jgi:hypothetical protein
MNTHGDDPGDDSIPLWLLHENEVEAWRATLAPPLARWLALQNFKGENTAWCCCRIPAAA